MLSGTNYLNSQLRKLNLFLASIKLFQHFSMSLHHEGGILEHRWNAKMKDGGKQSEKATGLVLLFV